MFRTGNADLIQAGTEACVIEVQSTVGGGQHHAASVESERPQRHTSLFAGLQQPCPTIVPRFCDQHRLNPLQPRPVLLGGMKRGRDGLCGAKVRLHLSRATGLDQSIYCGDGKARLEDQPDLLAG